MLLFVNIADLLLDLPPIRVPGVVALLHSSLFEFGLQQPTNFGFLKIVQNLSSRYFLRLRVMLSVTVKLSFGSSISLSSSILLLGY